MADAHKAAGERHRAASGWTDEREALVRKLWNEGQSATQIMKQMKSGHSRNAVLGKLHRMGMLRERKEASAPRRAASIHGGARAKPQQPRLVASPPVPLPDFKHDAPGAVTILTLGPRMCRWPIGDPQDTAFTLCGQRADGVYCAGHAARAYVTPNPKKIAATNQLRSHRRHA